MILNIGDYYSLQWMHDYIWIETRVLQNIKYFYIFYSNTTLESVEHVKSSLEWVMLDFYLAIFFTVVCYNINQLTKGEEKT